MWLLISFLLLGAWQDAKANPEAEQVTEAVRVTAVVVPKGRTVRLRPQIKSLLSRVAVPDDKVARFRPASETSILIEGLAVGIARLTITDLENGEEKLIVIVETPADIPRQRPGK